MVFLRLRENILGGGNLSKGSVPNFTPIWKEMVA
jgi:hypothetical protein